MLKMFEKVIDKPEVLEKGYGAWIMAIGVWAVVELAKIASHVEVKVDEIKDDFADIK